jgi:hypothetical protein
MMTKAIRPEDPKPAGKDSTWFYEQLYDDPDFKTAAYRVNKYITENCTDIYSLLPDRNYLDDKARKMVDELCEQFKITEFYLNQYFLFRGYAGDKDDFPIITRLGDRIEISISPNTRLKLIKLIWAGSVETVQKSMPGYVSKKKRPWYDQLLYWLYKGELSGTRDEVMKRYLDGDLDEALGPLASRHPLTKEELLSKYREHLPSEVKELLN